MGIALTAKMQRLYDTIRLMGGESDYEQKILKDIARVADDELDARGLYADSHAKRGLPAQRDPSLIYDPAINPYAYSPTPAHRRALAEATKNVA